MHGKNKLHSVLERLIPRLFMSIWHDTSLFNCRILLDPVFFFDVVSCCKSSNMGSNDKTIHHCF